MYKKQKKQKHFINLFTLIKNNSNLAKVDKINYKNDKMRIKFGLCFIFSIIKIHQHHEEIIKGVDEKNDYSSISDYDILRIIEEITFFLEEFPLNIYETLRKYIQALFGINSNLMETFYNEFMLPFDYFKKIEIEFKSFSYEMIPSKFNREKDIFDYLVNFPNEDPKQIFGYHFNQELEYNYKRYFIIETLNKLKKKNFL